MWACKEEAHSSGLPFAQAGGVQMLCAIHAPPQQGRGDLVVQGGRVPIICLIYGLPLLVPPAATPPPLVRLCRMADCSSHLRAGAS